MHEDASPPPPPRPSRTLDDIALLMRSFKEDGDAFYFFGASTMQQVEERIANLHLGTVPLVRPPIPRRPPLRLDTEFPGLPPLRVGLGPRDAAAAAGGAPQAQRDPSPPPRRCGCCRDRRCRCRPATSPWWSSTRRPRG